ncbi:unnamed protein product [Adineta steineri]|uniref:Uncharacterized protein n=1 Tax=Adineta steineri TaxID=433720 RepID=A0A815ZRM8_9BILA|nr:unnamed protein product [Adineta steineri]CAF1676111.1 unnamed protein product [Adineta steineri]
MHTYIFIFILLLSNGLLYGYNIDHGLKYKRDINTILSRIASIEENDDIETSINYANQQQNEDEDEDETNHPSGYHIISNK